MNYTTIRAAAGVFATFLSLPSSVLADDLERYDNFNGRFVNRAKWIGLMPAGGTEIAREIQGRKLRLMYRSFGQPTTPSGFFLGFQGLLFIDPTPITAIRATGHVKAFQVTDCPGNPIVSAASTRIFANFLTRQRLSRSAA